MATKKKTEDTPAEVPSQKDNAAAMIDLLAQAFAQALAQSKPKEKKSAVDRVENTPCSAKPGEKKEKLKRKMSQHGIPIDEVFIHPSTVALLNRLKVGSYLNGTVRVTNTKNGGIDFTYPMRTAAQKLRLVNQFGITNLDSLLSRCILEAGDSIIEE